MLNITNVEITMIIGFKFIPIERFVSENPNTKCPDIITKMLQSIKNNICIFVCRIVTKKANNKNINDLCKKIPTDIKILLERVILEFDNTIPRKINNTAIDKPCRIAFEVVRKSGHACA